MMIMDEKEKKRQMVFSVWSSVWTTFDRLSGSAVYTTTTTSNSDCCNNNNNNNTSRGY